MERCVFCKRRVWFWQTKAIDPSGTVRNDVHKSCRFVYEDASEHCTAFADKMCDIIGAPHVGDIYAAFCCPTYMTAEQLDANLARLRKKYGEPNRYWVLRNV